MFLGEYNQQGYFPTKLPYIHEKRRVHFKSHLSLQDQSMEAELVDVLCNYLDKFAEDEDIPTHVLLSLTCMADTGEWQAYLWNFFHMKRIIKAKPLDSKIRRMWIEIIYVGLM